MGIIPVFAGLGSEKLFAEDTSEQALNDARLPHGQILLEACHKTFLEEVTLASSKATEGFVGIDLADFQHPRDIIQPRSSYQPHPVVQHAALCVVQLLRYQGQSLWERSRAASSGFCAGLLPAVAAATATCGIQYIVRAEECFRTAVMLGIAIHRARRKIRPLPSLHPWSLTVANVDEQEVSELIQQYSSSRDVRVPIYISGRNSRTCVSVSGEGESLHDFAQAKLPSKCIVKPTNVFALYHNCTQLQASRDQLLEDFAARKLPFPSRADLLQPLISTIDGSFIECKDASTRDDLLSNVLDMILLFKTDWVAVQDSIVEFANKDFVHDQDLLTVCNHGPAYGALECSKEPSIEVQDVSRASKEYESSVNDIAIVGVGVDLPDAPDLDTLWENLTNALNSCIEIPSERFRVEDYCVAKDEGDDAENSRTMKTRFGNFLQDPFSFPCEHFGISPREAASIDPQQRVMLQTVYRALENAGYVADSTPAFSRATFGCFVGNATLDYVDNLKDDIDVYYSPGTLRAFLSGRISYAFQWSGPSITVDTACSSSIVALHQAVQALLVGECRAAVAGGVNIITSPDMYLGLDRGHFLSPTGQCKAFDESADGYCRGEGSAAFVLKRLDDAIFENDRIWGVIKGVAVNQSGSASSITHPHPATQADLFRKLLAKSSVNAEHVSVAESHGTGTQAGDPSELKSIRQVFCQRRGADNPLHVGSIKSNIGHLEAASGGAALAKLLLMMKHNWIPPQALFQHLNPAIESLSVDGTIISAEGRDWNLGLNNKRTALLNNFGAAGSNAAVLLQQYEASPLRCSSEPGPERTYVFGCSARSPELLERTREDLIEYLLDHKNAVSIADVCYTSTARRGIHTFRLSAAASSLQQLLEQLQQASVVQVQNQVRPTVFLFSGQGSQYPGMGSDLYHASTSFRKTVDRCDQILTEWDLPSCLEVILSDDENSTCAADPRMLRAFQTGVYVLEVALAQLLIELGIQPSFVAGHSLGEYAALVVAGVLDIESGLWLVSQRARLIVNDCELWQTSMLAVDMSATEVREEILVQSQFKKLSISCENSPNDCVVGGDTEALIQLKAYISGQLERKCALLDVPVAYHTAALEPVLGELKTIAEDLCISSPTIPIASNVLGRLVQPGEEYFTPEYFAEHCRNPVSFDSPIAAILRTVEEQGPARWIEVGPHPALLPMVAPRVQDGASELLPTLMKRRHSSEILAKLFAACYLDDLWTMNWRAIYEQIFPEARLVDIPPAPLNREKYFVPLKRESLETPIANGQSLGFAVLDRKVEPEEGVAATFETPIQSLANLIKGHVVCGSALCPASVYTEMALAGLSHLEEQDCDDKILKLSDLEFASPLILSDGSSLTVRLNLTSTESGGHSFEVVSFDASKSANTTQHATGTAKWQSLSKARSKSLSTTRLLSRRKTALLNGEHQKFTSRTMYDKLFSRVVEYSPLYQAVQSIYLDENSEEIFATCVLPPSGANIVYAGNPVLLDTMLHVAGFAANLNVDDKSVCICHHVRSAVLLAKKFEPGQSFEVHCSNFVESTDPDTVLADCHATDTEGVIAIIKGMAFRRTELSKVRSAFAAVTESISLANQNNSNPSRRAIMPDDDERQPRALEPWRSPSQEEDILSRTVRETLENGKESSQKSPAAADAMDILSQATGVPKEDMTSQTDLSSLGVDSMMIFELKKRLEMTVDQQPSIAQLTAVKTVGEFEEITSAEPSKAQTPAPKVRSPSPRRHDTPQGSPKSGLIDDSHGTPNRVPSVPALAYDTESTKWNEDATAEPQLSTEMVDVLRDRLGLEEQPERIEREAGGSHQAALLLIHSGAGMCNFYRRIGKLDRAILAVHDPRIFCDWDDDWRSLDEIAEHYITILRDHLASARSVILGGWSFGGVVAFEMARILLERWDIDVRGVVLIDSPSPKDHVPMSRTTIEAATDSHRSTRSMARGESTRKFEEALRSLIIRNNMRRGALLGRHRSKESGPMPRTILLRSREGLELSANTAPGDRWLVDRSDADRRASGWEELTATKVEVIDIPGNHFTPFEPGKNVEGTTRALRRACDMLD